VAVGRIEADASTALGAEVVCEGDDLSRLGPEWDALHAASAATLPFNSFAWVDQWWRAFGRTAGLRRDALRVVVLREADGAMRAIVPLVLTSLGPGALSLRKLRPCGSVRKRNLTEIPSPLFSPGFEGPGASALLQALPTLRPSFHWCDLLLPAGSALADRLATLAGRGAAPRQPVTNYVITLPDSWEALRLRLRRNIKESLRHCYNSLRRDGRQWVFRLVEDPASAEAATADFLTLHRARARSEKGPQHLDQFPGRAHHRFLVGLMAGLMARGFARYCELWIDGKLAASRIAFTYGDSVYLYYSGFDPGLGRYSVTTTLAAECVKWAIGRRARTLSLSPGRDVSKTRWDPEPQEYRWLRFEGRAPGARAVMLIP
jgi:CelD/BcsL family acetyltransferase involved in cellulose biosynthesis